VLDGLDRQVDVEIGPVEMLLGWSLNVEKVIDDRAPEPRKLLEWEKELSIAQENPQPLTRDVVTSASKVPLPGIPYLLFVSTVPGDDSSQVSIGYAKRDQGTDHEVNGNGSVSRLYFRDARLARVYQLGHLLLREIQPDTALAHTLGELQLELDIRRLLGR